MSPPLHHLWEIAQHLCVQEMPVFTIAWASATVKARYSLIFTFSSFLKQISPPGLRCDHCSLGFKFLRSFHDGGCEPCRCDPFGSASKLCDPLSGQCECKAEASGLRCDTCREHFYGLDGTGCKACACDPAGSLPGTVCDAGTGQCHCRPHVGGRQCDGCLESFFYLQQNNSFLCLPCDCDKTGTVNGSALCDKSTGQCPCKSGVTGLRCSQCKPHRYSLTAGDSQGCRMCECDSAGTLPGTACDPSSGQCRCLPNRQGRRCDQCQPGKRVLCCLLRAPWAFLLHSMAGHSPYSIEASNSLTHSVSVEFTSVCGTDTSAQSSQDRVACLTF